MVSAIRFCGDNKRFSVCVRALRFQGRRRRLLVSCVAPPTDHSRDITISSASIRRYFSRFVCSFGGYHVPLLGHLVHTKIRHWDPELRLLSAQAIGRLANLGGAGTYMEKHIVPTLLDNAQHRTDVLCRHGR